MSVFKFVSHHKLNFLFFYTWNLLGWPLWHTLGRKFTIFHLDVEFFLLPGYFSFTLGSKYNAHTLLWRQKIASCARIFFTNTKLAPPSPIGVFLSGGSNGKLYKNHIMIQQLFFHSEFTNLCQHTNVSLFSHLGFFLVLLPPTFGRKIYIFPPPRGIISCQGVLFFSSHFSANQYSQIHKCSRSVTPFCAGGSRPSARPWSCNSQWQRQWWGDCLDLKKNPSKGGSQLIPWNATSETPSQG